MCLNLKAKFCNKTLFFFLLQDFITSFYEGWRDLMDNKSDPRTRDWPLMSSPFPTIAMSLTYAYFVKVGNGHITCFFILSAFLCTINCCVTGKQHLRESPNRFIFKITCLCYFCCLYNKQNQK